jgi:hypothetical protein
MRIQQICLTALLLGLGGIPSEAADQEVWGLPKAGARIGAKRLDWTGTSNGIVIIYVVRTTNYMKDLVIPANPYQCLDYSLRGTNSLLVEPTQLGKGFGASLETTMPRWRRVSHELKNLGDEPQQVASFKIDECFTVREAGDYELEIRPRLLREIGNKAKTTLTPFGGSDTMQLQPVLYDPIKLRLHLVRNLRSK